MPKHYIFDVTHGDEFGEEAHWFGPDMALAGVWAFCCSSDVQCILADSSRPTPLLFQISTHYFFIEFSTDASCKLVIQEVFYKSQSYM